jgi:hypothetical protein
MAQKTPVNKCRLTPISAISGLSDGNVNGPNGEELTPAGLADTTLSQSNYSPGMPVQLNSCYAGQGGDNSFAQQYSNALGAPVQAPTGFEQVNPNGSTQING